MSVRTTAVFACIVGLPALPSAGWAQRRSDALRAHAVVDRLRDHFVLRNRVEAIDAGIVGEAFVVPGDAAVGLGLAQARPPRIRNAKLRYKIT